jgi:hypothetical protein
MAIGTTKLAQNDRLVLRKKRRTAICEGISDFLEEEDERIEQERQDREASIAAQEAARREVILELVRSTPDEDAVKGHLGNIIGQPESAQSLDYNILEELIVAERPELLGKVHELRGDVYPYADWEE